MNHYRIVLLNILRVIGVVFASGSAFITVLDLFEVNQAWGATFLLLVGGIFFVAIGASIVWVTTVALKRAGPWP
jgi:hypothetical protein